MQVIYTELTTLWIDGSSELRDYVLVVENTEDYTEEEIEGIIEEELGI